MEPPKSPTMQVSPDAIQVLPLAQPRSPQRHHHGRQNLSRANRYSPYSNPRNTIQPSISTHDPPVYMQSIDELVELDEAIREVRIEKLERYNFTDSKSGDWKPSEESYSNLVKKHLKSANLNILKSYAVGGIRMTPKTFKKTLKKYIKEETYKEKDFVDVLIQKWENLTLYANKDGVEDFDPQNQVKALSKINVNVNLLTI